MAHYLGQVAVLAVLGPVPPDGIRDLQQQVRQAAQRVLMRLPLFPLALIVPFGPDRRPQRPQSHLLRQHPVEPVAAEAETSRSKLTALDRLRSSARETLYGHGTVESSPVIAEERVQAGADNCSASRHTAESLHLITLCAQPLDLGIVSGYRSLDHTQLLDDRQRLLPLGTHDNCRHRRRITTQDRQYPLQLGLAVAVMLSQKSPD